MVCSWNASIAIAIYGIEISQWQVIEIWYWKHHCEGWQGTKIP